MSPINRITIIGCSLLFLILLLMGVWYVVRISNQQPIGQPSPSPSFTPFSEANQVVPQGATSLSITNALAAFNLPKPLPFFDERNVVQSLSQPQATDTIFIRAPESSKPPTIISLNYRVPGHDISAVRDAFLLYFKDIGWRENTTINSTNVHPSQDFFSLSFVYPTSLNTMQVLLSPSQDGSIIVLSFLPPFRRSLSPSSP